MFLGYESQILIVVWQAQEYFTSTANAPHFPVHSGTWTVRPSPYSAEILTIKRQKELSLLHRVLLKGKLQNKTARIWVWHSVSVSCFASAGDAFFSCNIFYKVDPVQRLCFLKEKTTLQYNALLSSHKVWIKYHLTNDKGQEPRFTVEIESYVLWLRSCQLSLLK